MLPVSWKRESIHLKQAPEMKTFMGLRFRYTDWFLSQFAVIVNLSLYLSKIF